MSNFVAVISNIYQQNFLRETSEIFFEILFILFHSKVSIPFGILKVRYSALLRSLKELLVVLLE